jgi:hypothetical protein
MAKVELSALLDSLTGKLGGSVFQKTVGGLQVRTRVSPRNPRSAFQQLRRSDWSFAALSWLTLSPTEITSWNDNAPAGQTGSSFYLATNAMIQTAGKPLLREFLAPGAQTTQNNTFDTLTPGSVITGKLTNDAVLDGSTCCNVFCTRPLSGGTSFISPSDYVLIKSLQPGAATGSPIEITAEYLDRFVELQIGQLVGIKYYTINWEKGGQDVTQFAQSYVS